jgi:hypothetical protein
MVAAMKYPGVAVAMIVVSAACGSSAPPPPAAAPAQAVAAAPVPVAPPPAADRRDIELPGDANGLYWDASDRALYLTDATHDALIKWTDDGAFATIAELPPAAARS